MIQSLDGNVILPFYRTLDHSQFLLVRGKYFLEYLSHSFLFVFLIRFNFLSRREIRILLQDSLSLSIVEKLYILFDHWVINSVRVGARFFIFLFFLLLGLVIF